MIETKNPFSTQLTNIMTVRDLKMHFPVTKGLLKHPVGAVKAVDGVSFDIKREDRRWVWWESPAPVSPPSATA